MIRFNETNLVEMLVQGVPAHPMRFGSFEVDAQGKAHMVPSVGGITTNIKIGDTVFGWKADHVEPGVSVLLDPKNRSSKESQALQFLSCTGNDAYVVSGGAKGSKGVVVGHHGGVEHLIIDFDDKALSKMTYDDKIMIKTIGQGLEIDGVDDIKVYNCDPRLIHSWGIKIKNKEDVEVPVAAIVPAAIMGSGIGSADPGTGDYDITTQDPKIIRRFALENLRFGDFVAITDADHSYGRHFYEGAITIGIVIHSDSFLSGHGPGVSTLLTSKKGSIKPVLNSNANLGKVLGIGKYRKKNKKTRLK